MVPQPRSETTVTLRIESVAQDGRGLARIGDREVLVRGALPGDLVEARVHRRTRLRYEAYLLTLLEEGIPRRKPACGHVSECGGCRWQECPIESQRAMKRSIVERALADSLGSSAPAVLPVREVSPEFGYRNKMEFTFSGDGDVTLGLHRAGSYLAAFDLDRCWLAPGEVSQVVAWVRAWANRYHLPAYDKRTHQGILRHLVVRFAAATREIMANLVATTDTFDGLDDLTTGLPEAIPQVKSLLLGVTTRNGDTAIPESTALLAGQETITERIGPFEVRVSARSFLQTNTIGAESLYGLVAERAALNGQERVLDLYCGIGLIGLWLAKNAREVVGVDQIAEAIADGNRLRNSLGYDHVRFVAADAERLLPIWVQEGEHFDVAVVDPPRVGLHPKALAALVRLHPRRIVYVSCNASALADNMKALADAGYVSGSVQPLDMFPQTPHVELVVALELP